MTNIERLAANDNYLHASQIASKCFHDDIPAVDSHGVSYSTWGYLTPTRKLFTTDNGCYDAYDAFGKLAIITSNHDYSDCDCFEDCVKEIQEWFALPEIGTNKDFLNSPWYEDFLCRVLVAEDAHTGEYFPPDGGGPLRVRFNDEKNRFDIPEIQMASIERTRKWLYELIDNKCTRKEYLMREKNVRHLAVLLIEADYMTGKYYNVFQKQYRYTYPLSHSGFETCIKDTIEFLNSAVDNNLMRLTAEERMIINGMLL